MKYQYNFRTGLTRAKTNTKKYVSGAIATVLLVGGMSYPVFSAGHSQNGFTVGDCISDGLYGNEPNMANGALGGPSEQDPGTKGGNVVPTQSPGPFVNNPSDPDNPTRGRSVGQFQQDDINVPEICRTLAGQ